MTGTKLAASHSTKQGPVDSRGCNKIRDHVSRPSLSQNDGMSSFWSNLKDVLSGTMPKQYDIRHVPVSPVSISALRVGHRRQFYNPIVLKTRRDVATVGNHQIIDSQDGTK